MRREMRIYETETRAADSERYRRSALVAEHVRDAYGGGGK